MHLFDIQFTWRARYAKNDAREPGRHKRYQSPAECRVRQRVKLQQLFVH